MAKNDNTPASLFDPKIVGDTKPVLPNSGASDVPSLFDPSVSGGNSKATPAPQAMSLFDPKIVGQQAVTPEDTDSFGTNFGEGLEMGGRQLWAGAKYAAADIGQVFTDDDVWAREIKNWAKDYVAQGPAPDDSVGQFLGSLVPSTIPSALAIGSVFVSGGSTLPAVASWAAAGGLGLASAGQGMMEYDTYKESIGEVADPASRAAVGLSYFTAEMLLERLALGKLMPANIGNFTLRGNVDMAEKAGKQMISNYAKKTKTSVPQLLKRIGTGSSIEGAQEAFTELAQNITDNTYREMEDQYDFGTILNNMKHAAIGGAIMGTGLGAMSYKAQDVVNNRRRKDQGFVRIGELNGEGVEILGMNKNGDKLSIMYADGNVSEVNPNDVKDPVNITPDQFQNLLKGKTDETNAVENSRIETQRQMRKEFTDGFDQAFSEHVMQTEEGDFITMGTMGEVPVVVSKVADQETARGGVYVAEVVMDEAGMPVNSGNLRLVDQKQIDGTTSMPVEQWQNTMLGPKLSNIADPSLPAPEIGEPIQHPLGNGEIIAYDPQTGDATIEIKRPTGKKEGDFESIHEGPVDRAVLDQYRTFNRQAPEKASQDAQAMREQFDENGNPVNVEEAAVPEAVEEVMEPISLEVSSQPEPISANQIERGVYEIPGKKAKEASQLASEIQEEYPNLGIEVIDKTNVEDPLAKSNFVVQIKTEKNDRKPADSDISASKEGDANRGENQRDTRPEEVSDQSGDTGAVSASDIQEEDGGRDVPSGRPEPDNQKKSDRGAAKNEGDSAKPVESGSEQIVSPRAKKQVTLKKKDNVRIKPNSNEGRPGDSSRTGDGKSLDPDRGGVSEKIQQGKDSRGNQAASMAKGQQQSGKTSDREASQRAQRRKVKVKGRNEYTAQKGYSDYKKLREEGFNKGEAISKLSQKYNRPYMKIDDDIYPLERADGPSFQKTVNASQEKDARLDGSDETNVSSEFVTPFIPKNKSVIEAEVAKFKKKFPNSPDIKVFEGYLDAQTWLLDEFPNTTFSDIYSRNAFIGPDSTVYMISSAPRFSNPAMIEQTLLHEIVGHYGVRQALDYVGGKGSNKKFNDFMGDVFEENKNDPRMKRVYEAYSNDPQISGQAYEILTKEQQIFVAEEYVAQISETNLSSDRTLIDRIVDWFKGVLGIKTDMTSDMVRDIIANGRRMVSVGDNMVDRSPVNPSLRFQKQLFHGTQYDFDTFMLSKKDGTGRKHFGHGLYFTDKEKIAKHYAKETGGRNVYQVTLHKGKTPEQYSYMNWDDALTKGQLKKIGSILGPIELYENVSGEQIYRDLSRSLGGDRQASAALLDVGIDGIYFQTFKGGIGTNYVVFDEGQINIDQKIRFQKAPPTDSKKFKKWFGDSKVVDENGDPLVVYHGTSSDFNEFKKPKENLMQMRSEVGFWFTGDKSETRKYGRRVVDAYLSIQNPRRISERKLDELAVSYPKEEVIRRLKKGGHDGLIIEEIKADRLTETEFQAEQYVAFSPTQIKSATDNSGQFSPDNPDIRFQNETKDNFYSNSLLAVRNVAQGKATGDQWKSMLLKNGATQSELDWIGFEDWLKDNPKPSKEEVYQFIQENQIEVVDVVKQGGNLDNDLDDFVIIEDHIREFGFWENESGTISIQQANRGGFEVQRLGEPGEIVDELEEAFELVDTGSEGSTKYSQYTLPGGENYKELLLTMPRRQFKPLVSFEEWNYNRSTWGDPKGTREEYKKAMSAPLGSEKYKSSHWDEPNVLSHIRFNERRVGDDKVLFIEEIQSDWAQAGRKKGFRGQEKLPFPDKVLQAAVEGGMTEGQARKDIEFLLEEPTGTTERPTSEQWSRLNEAIGYDSDIDLNEIFHDLPTDFRMADAEKIPNMPFRQTSQWMNLSMRRMIKYASDNGFDRIAWVTGEQSAERYDLSKQIDAIDVKKMVGDKGRKEVTIVKEDQPIETFSIESNGVVYAAENPTLEGKKLDEVIGKETAQKVLDVTQDVKTFSGLDLEVGGEGMKSFYNQILPKTTQKLLKKLDKGITIEIVNVPTSAKEGEGIEGWEIVDQDTGNVFRSFGSEEEYQNYVDEVIDIGFESLPENWYGRATGEYIEATQQLSFPITPLIRQKAINQGMPMFQKEAPLQYTRDGFKGWMDKQVFHWQDRYRYLQLLQESKRKAGRTISDDMNAYDKENLSSGKINEEQEKFRESYVNPLDKTLKSIKNRDNISYEEVGRYLQAKHISVDGVEKGGIPIEEANNIVQDFEGRISKENLEALTGDITRIRDFNLDKKLEYGLISKGRYDLLRSQYKFYIPLRGFADLQGEDKTRLTKDYKREGRESEAANPIPYMMVDAQTVITNGEQNRVKQSLLEFVKQNPDSRFYNIRNAWYLTDKSTGEVTAKYSTPTPEEFQKFDISRQDPLPENMTMEQYKNFRRSSVYEEDALGVMVDGKKVFIEFTDANISGVFKKQGLDKMPKFFNWMNSGIAYLRKAYTQYSPEFGPRNFIRDISTGLINVRNDFGTKTSTDVLKNIDFKTTWRGIINRDFSGEKGQMLQEFIEQGGLTGYSDMQDVSEIHKEWERQIEGIGKEIGSLGDLKNAVKQTKGFKYTLGALDNFNRMLENTTRFAVYRTLREKGQSPQKAAIYAKDVTVNFNRKGTRSSALSGLYLFWNASIQGIERLARPFVSEDKAIRKRAVETLLTLPMLHMSLVMLNEIVGGDDEDGESYYSKLSPYDRTHNLILPNPFASDDADAGARFFRVPLPYGYNVFFAWPDNIIEAVRGRQTPEDAVMNTLAIGMESFSPLGAPQFDSDLSVEGKALTYFAPTIGKIPLEIAFNTNFMGLPIYKEQGPFDTPRPDSEMYFNSVDPLFKEIARGLNAATGGDREVSGTIDINPEVMEHYVSSYSGGLGKFMVNSMATLMNLSTDGKETFTTEKIKSVPFVRNYVTSPSSYQNRSDFFAKAREIEAKEDILRRKKKSGDKAGAMEYRKENMAFLRMGPLAKTYRKRIKTLEDSRLRYENLGETELAEKVEKRQQELFKKFNMEFKRSIDGKPGSLIALLGLD